MIKIYELKEENEIKQVLEKFSVQHQNYVRYFAQKEGDIFTGLFSMRYDGGIKVKDIVLLDGYGFDYFDLLVRGSLNAVRDMKGLKVYINSDNTYFEGLGFKKSADGQYVCDADKINFAGSCGGK